MPRCKEINLIVSRPSKPENGQRTTITLSPTLINPAKVENICPVQQNVFYREWLSRDLEGVLTKGPLVLHCDICTDERTYRDVEGSADQLNRYLFPSACEDAVDTGVVLAPTGCGWVTLQGDCGGERDIGTGHTFVLDPGRLIGAEWLVVRPADAQSLWRWELRVAADAAFVPQRFIPSPEPDGTGNWQDMTGTSDLQATTRIRPKP